MGGRSYQQFCGLAKALDVLGDRWTLLLVREMLLCPRRYTDLISLLPGITTNLLAKRLKEMRAEGLITKDAHEAYYLTEDGRALEPAVMALAAWGTSHRMQRGPERGDTKNIGWAALSMKRRFVGASGSCVVEIRSAQRSFQYVLSPSGFSLEEGGERIADITIAGEFDPLAAWFFQGAPLANLESSKKLLVAGDRDALPIFTAAFGLRI